MHMTLHVYCAKIFKDIFLENEASYEETSFYIFGLFFDEESTLCLLVVLHCRDTLYRTIYYSRIFVSYRFFEAGAVSLMGPGFMGKRRFSGIS